MQPTHKLRKLGIGLGILLMATLGVLVWRNAGPKEPVYEGKPLSLWLRGHVASSAADPPYGSPGWQKADQVLRRIGTNAIPVLLKMISAKDPPRVVLKAMQWARSRRLAFAGYRYASTRNEEARYAFEVMGPTAAAAVPDLIKIYERGVSPNSKRCTASALGSIRDAAQAALPVLLKDFVSPDRQVRFDAVTAVVFIRGDPKTLVPALQAMLKDPMVEIQGNAAVALSMYGARARATVPALLEALQALPPNHPQKELVQTSIWRIAPEAVGKPLVVEQATPMVSGGSTTAALALEFNGQRRTLVPPGRNVPCEGQLWTQEPRSPLKLYRIENRPTKEERYLGEFEVVDVPPPPAEINVTVLCLVLESNIVLCARDNNRNEFLQVRRVK